MRVWKATGEGRVKAGEAGEADGGQATPALWMEESWGFICSAAGTAGRAERVRGFICLKSIKDFVIG